MDAIAQPIKTGDLVLGDNFRVDLQMRDALRLSEFAVTSGFKTSDGTPIPSEMIAVIQTTSAKLGFFKEPGRLQEIGQVPDDPAALKGSVSAAEWVEFQLAYYKLSTLMSPVTAQTLVDTESYTRSSHYSSFWTRLGERLLGASPANRFTRRIWLVAICFVVFVVSADWYAGDAAKNSHQSALLLSLVQIMALYAYGGLGACASLLRSAHTFIYKRTFDIRRQPEYFNRILLGTIAGGTIILFVKPTDLPRFFGPRLA
jgi:hypothetical protein